MAPATSNHPDSKEEVGQHPAGPRPSNEDRLAGLTQQLQTLLENAISTPGRWHMLLDTSATLWRYSGGNIALLMAQMEERGQQQPLLGGRLSRVGTPRPQCTQRRARPVGPRTTHSNQKHGCEPGDRR